MSQTDDIILSFTNPSVWLETLTELNGEPTRLEPYQVRVLNDLSPFRIVNKARQIGLSTVIAAEALHGIATKQNVKYNVISINQKEASDKIDIARNLYHSLPDELKEMGLKPVMWTDSENELSLHKPPHTSTLLSQPASAAVRGGRKDIIFDEFAHVRDAKKLYQAAMPAITRGGRMTIISTPLGQSGLFYEICSDEAAYPQYSRHNIPWWESSAHVKPGYWQEALAHAADLNDPKLRVRTYGSDILQAIWDGFGGDTQSFVTEYEATFVDETTAYFPWELIQSCVDDDGCPIWKDIPPGWEPTGQVSIGVDLAKERDESVFTVVEHFNMPDGVHKFVRFVYATQEDYDKQLDYLFTLAKKVKASRVSIDQTGVGQVFVEQAKRRAGELPGCAVEGIVFTNSNKERWATRFKGELQSRTAHLSRLTQLTRQVHGIQRTKTESNFYKFSGPRDDYFWSLMLAYYGDGRVPARIRVLGA